MGQQSSVAPSPLSTGLATAVRVLLARRGLQQKDLTRVAGRSGAYWSKRLNGQLGFTLLDVERLADLGLLTIEDDDRADLNLLLPAAGSHNCVNHFTPCFRLGAHGSDCLCETGKSCGADC